LRAIQIDTERVRREFYQGEKTYARLFTLIEGHFAEKQGKPRWGDKSLNTERYMDDIFAVFPNAKIIHMMRDPRDRYASAKTRWTEMKGRVGAGTAMWLESVKLARRGQRKYPGHYMVVRYEDLVAQPEQMLHKICDFLGEQYVPEMLTMTMASARSARFQRTRLHVTGRCFRLRKSNICRISARAACKSSDMHSMTFSCPRVTG
jgi:hypothetical protein